MKQKLFRKTITGLLTLLLLISANFAIAQSDIAAIDIILSPDKTMLDSAKFYNHLMLENYNGPGSFSLDEIHNPHISVLQCFIRTKDLKEIYKAVSKVFNGENPVKETLTANGFYYFPYNGLGLAGITADTTSWLIRFQAKIIEAAKPFIVKGTDAGFVQNKNGAPIAKGSSDYVNDFIPAHSGPKFNPHVTIGLAQEDFLKELLAKPFNRFTFGNNSVSIYQLGDFGTAQKKLWTSSTRKK
jgi:hypothetical protein